MFAELISFWVFFFVIPGLCTFTLTPINITVCSRSTVQFACSATDVIAVSYSSNSTENVYISAPTYIGRATIVNMSISNASANAVITCLAYSVNGVELTREAYLTVQGPPSPTTNLNITTYNDTATLLVWGPPPDAQSPSLLSYAVVIRNGSGAPVYSETVRESQLAITTPDPCGHYEATVTPMCGSITGVQISPIKLGSIPASIRNNVNITLFSSPSDNVSVNISLPLSSNVCYYKMVALSASEILTFPSVKPLPSLYKVHSTITVSLPPNKHFNLTITAYNGYGNTSTTVVISTFTSSPMGLVCLFNTSGIIAGSIVVSSAVVLIIVITGPILAYGNETILRNGNKTTSAYSITAHIQSPSSKVQNSYDHEEQYSKLHQSQTTSAYSITTHIQSPAPKVQHNNDYKEQYSKLHQSQTTSAYSITTHLQSPALKVQNNNDHEEQYSKLHQSQPFQHTSGHKYSAMSSQVHLPIRPPDIDGVRYSSVHQPIQQCSEPTTNLILGLNEERIIFQEQFESAAPMYENTCTHQSSIRSGNCIKSKVPKLSGVVAFKASTSGIKCPDHRSEGAGNDATETHMGALSPAGWSATTGT
ncbi:hypothetical protein EMCRGX_G017497 [Ephydatia muelleri]